MPDSKNIRNLATEMSVNETGTIDEADKYNGNKTTGKLLKASLIITLAWLIFCVIFGIILAACGVDILIIMAIELPVGAVTVVSAAVVYVKKVNAGLSARQLILLNEGYGQFVILNGEAYYVDCTKKMTKQEATQIVNDYYIEHKNISEANIFKLLDIKSIKTKKYKGKPLDIIGFTYLSKDTDKIDNRLHSTKIPIYHDDTQYSNIINMPRFVETEDDIKKDNKDLLKAFIAATVVLLVILILRYMNFIIMLILAAPICYAWFRTTNEVKSHTAKRFLVRTYIVLVCLLGMYFLAVAIDMANRGFLGY